MRDTSAAVILHDYVEQPDGGSRLCLILGRSIEADFYCGFIRSGHPFFATPYPGQVRTLVPGLPVPLARQLALALAFEHRARSIAGYKTAIFSGAYAPLAAKLRAGLANVYYCHTPPRFLYDQHNFFLELTPAPFRPFFTAFCRWLRPKYEASLSHMNSIVVNSQAVQKRVLQHLGLEAKIVHPPCDIGRYTTGADHGYFLSMARLDPLKRVEVAIQAFRAMPGQRLVVTSHGPESENLKRLAAGAPNIKFTGAVDEPRLLALLSQCRATICLSRDEDFGMAAVESMAAGKPVLAVAEGGFLETVRDGETGVLLPPACSPQELSLAVTAMDSHTASCMATACQKRAQDYSTETFLAGMNEAIRAAAGF